LEQTDVSEVNIASIIRVMNNHNHPDDGGSTHLCNIVYSESTQRYTAEGSNHQSSASNLVSEYYFSKKLSLE
jgi:hypothetical protein